MDNELYSKKFAGFCEMLISNFSDINNINSYIASALKLVADDLKLGLLTMDVVIPVSVRVPQGKNVRYHLYEASEYEEEYKEYQFLTADGGRINFQVHPILGYEYDEEDEKHISFIVKIIAYVCKYVRISGYEAMTPFMDSLTGALNSNGLMRNGGILFIKNDISEYASVFFNIKNFSQFNHEGGAKLGDEILKKYSIAINSYIQKDELFARIGGDGFVVFIKKTRVDDFVDFISKMKIRANTKRGPKDFEVMTSIGLYFAVPKDNIANMLNYSLTACKYARQSKNTDCVWFREYMIDDDAREKEISYKFYDAVSEEKFEVFYQPKVDLETDSLGGAEALVRWASKERLIKPSEFIPVLEKEGTIKDLDFYMLKHVCMDIRSWLDRGIKPVPISVNFSKIHIFNDNLAERISTVIKEYGIDPKYIEIEITEMSDLDHNAALKEFVDAMNKRKIKTSIDDFGIGLASINILRDLDVDCIKLDKIYTDRLVEGNDKDYIIISSLVDMLKKIGKNVIAEGVEKTEQVDYLKKMGCKYAQGYLFDEPIKNDEFINILTSKKY